MYACEDFEFVYFGNPKTGSSKIISIIKEHFVIKEFANESSKYFPSTPHHSMILPQKYSGYLKISSIRDPYTRELSRFNAKPKAIEYNFLRKMSIEQYIDWICDRTMTKYWPHDYWKLSQKQFIFDQDVPEGCIPVEVDKYIRFENFRSTFFEIEAFRERVPRDSLDSFVNKTQYSVRSFPKCKYDSFYETFAEDFESFGYERRNIITML